MCLMILAWQTHPEFPLIVVANRDEYHQRPSTPLHFWTDAPDILAGRDLKGGGTWLGVNRNGRWAGVTNYREGRENPAPRSRGDLTREFLQGGMPAVDYAGQVIRHGADYNGFNLLVGDSETLAYCSNRHSAAKILPPGIYSLSNHLLDSPWPKAEHAKAALTALLQKQQTPDFSSLAACLQRQAPFADEVLPDTGVGIALERMLSPPFICGHEYGTRCTSVLLMSRAGTMEMTEQNYQPGGRPGQRLSFTFSLDRKP